MMTACSCAPSVNGNFFLKKKICRQGKNAKVQFYFDIKAGVKERVANGKCKNLEDGETSIFFWEPKTF